MSHPLLLPEIVASVIDNVYMVPDLLSCACVNHVWNVTALRKLYKGSLNDMRFRTPDIGSLNCLFVASRKRFARNMSFVKHLLLSTETLAADHEVRPSKITCYEKCRALRHRKDAELLLRPQGRGLASLTIPFEIEDQNWSLISDLLLTPTIEFLAIPQSYCRLLLASSSYSQELITPADKFSNLKALTIYKSDSYLVVAELCRLLELCDLQFFHLEEVRHIDAARLTQFDIAEVLSRLRRHQNLETLALITPHCPPPLGSTREGQGNPWPRLKALYLAGGPHHWLEQLPKFDELQILSLLDFEFGTPIMDGTVIEYIAKCKHLRVIDLGYLELDNVEALLDIAHGCPLLQKFSVKDLQFSGEPDLGEDSLLNLLRALPQLEFLALGLEFQLNGAKLRDLANHCPRLAVLDLPRTELFLALELMTDLDPLWHLETMSFAKIYFLDPRRLMQSDNLQSLATEWCRIFPRLREQPCPDDGYSRYLSHGDSSEISDGDRASVSANEKTSLTEPGLDFPGLDFDDYESDWYMLRRKLWRVLGYGKDPHSPSMIQYMWQTNLEIEAIGWPVVPLAAFSDPDLHSTTDKRFP